MTAEKQINSTGTAYNVLLYKSDWVWIPPRTGLQFAHKLGKLPTFLNVYVAAYLAGISSAESWIPTSVFPYQDWPSGGIKINMVTPQVISVWNGGDSAIYVQTQAALISSQAVP